MRPVSISRTLANAVVNSIALAQTTGAAGNLVLAGALVSAGVATIAVPAQVSITSTGNLSGITFTFTGKDYRGQSITEARAGPNNNTVLTTSSFAEISNVAVSAAVGTNVTVGNAQSGSSPVIIPDQYISPFNVSLFLEVSGTVNDTVQYTGDPVFVTTSLDLLRWINHADLTAKVADAQGTIQFPVTGIRLFNNSGDGTSVLRANQSGGPW